MLPAARLPKGNLPTCIFVQPGTIMRSLGRHARTTTRAAPANALLGQYNDSDGCLDMSPMGRLEVRPVLYICIFHANLASWLSLPNLECHPLVGTCMHMAFGMEKCRTRYTIGSFLGNLPVILLAKERSI
jgi:hypothetical protein